ncbi:2-oxoacid:ferredoxin oxidoreductase subunit gamma [Candidatus Aerophobetes bacterium]|uniref:2-oxoacid:ferredoxin oxidoreductase subunit gamma n=1 Tax=Aerophobetes bacterium TaxID=2030807 RepID=A0A662D4C1_UNCAE|nr:MAG: 2-oxoacid:ferredoxin oxidoreductase subunit gamma [Candidatus Aerophobetes bacterium]
MYEDLLIAGFGGQGIIFAGKLLAYAGLREGKEVVYFPSYGAEMRGGTANCTVIISTSPIASPIVSSPLNAIIMSQPSFLKFFPRVKKGGRVVLNTSLVRNELNRNDVEIIKVPANEIAEDLGSSRVANMVILGAWVKRSGVVLLDSLIQSLGEVLSKDKIDLLSLNERALRKGEELV